MFDRESWLSLLPFVVVCLAIAGIGALFTNSSVKTWYLQLRRPEWTPPTWIFGPVWTTLYLMMAFSAWLVWRGSNWTAARFALLLFAIQLVLNMLWSAVFFGMRRIGPAFGEILLLWMMIIASSNKPKATLMRCSVGVSCSGLRTGVPTGTVSSFR